MQLRLQLSQTTHTLIMHCGLRAAPEFFRVLTLAPNVSVVTLNSSACSLCSNELCTFQPHRSAAPWGKFACPDAGMNRVDLLQLRAGNFFNDWISFFSSSSAVKQVQTAGRYHEPVALQLRFRSNICIEDFCAEIVVNSCPSTPGG